jgi:hypothetical protein
MGPTGSALVAVGATALLLAQRGSTRATTGWPDDAARPHRRAVLLVALAVAVYFVAREMGTA